MQVADEDDGGESKNERQCRQKAILFSLLPQKAFKQGQRVVRGVQEGAMRQAWKLRQDTDPIGNFALQIAPGTAPAQLFIHPAFQIGFGGLP